MLFLLVGLLGVMGQGVGSETILCARNFFMDFRKHNPLTIVYSLVIPLGILERRGKEKGSGQESTGIIPMPPNGLSINNITF